MTIFDRKFAMSVAMSTLASILLLAVLIPYYNAFVATDPSRFMAAMKVTRAQCEAGHQAASATSREIAITDNLVLERGIARACRKGTVWSYDKLVYKPWNASFIFF